MALPDGVALFRPVAQADVHQLRIGPARLDRFGNPSHVHFEGSNQDRGGPAILDPPPQLDCDFVSDAIIHGGTMWRSQGPTGGGLGADDRQAYH